MVVIQFNIIYITFNYLIAKKHKLIQLNLVRSPGFEPVTIGFVAVASSHKKRWSYEHTEFGRLDLLNLPLSLSTSHGLTTFPS